MIELNKLIMKLCPDGVEYKEIGEIATDIYRGSGIKRDQVTSDGIPCVRYGEIYTTYGIWFDHCVSHIHETLIASKKYFEYGDILFAITGESVEDIAKSCAYIGPEKCLAGGDIVVLKHNENPKYLSYALATMDAQKQKSAGKVKSKVVHSNVPAIKRIVIPVPPLEVQYEIVRILDNFTELIRKLTTELAVRKKQYEYYREKLLLPEKEHNICWYNLCEIADIGTGSSNTNEGLNEGKYPFFVRSQEIKRKNDYEFDEIAIITAGDGVGVGKVLHYIEGKYALHQRAYRIHINTEKVLPKYFYHYMKGTFLRYIEKSAVNSSVTSIRKKMLDEYPVPVPTIEVQQKIVDILDNFDAICTDLNIGLPAEIEARKKQYEYYRDMLLTFVEDKNIVFDRAGG